MRKSSSSAGAGARAGDDTGKEDGKEEECAICLEALMDPLAPCAEQPSHRYCRTCVQEMQKQKLPSCPLCRGKMEDAVELLYESVQLNIRAEKVHTKAQRVALYAKQRSMLHRVLRVDPSCKEAQFNLGVMYREGQGVQQDSKQAVAWLLKAAEQGLAHAQGNLGNMYYNGEGVQQDFKQALAWSRKAAEQGVANAQVSLGLVYRQGEGVQQDFKQAAAWYQKAADQGYTMAHLMLGELSEKAGDYQAAFASYRAGQAADRDGARAGMRRSLEKMTDSKKKDQDVVHAPK
jgi:tetratricopeptide (TPR) repeat protein